jgi:thioredoxin reductase (NADPH)
VHLEDGGRIDARALIIASGAQYRKPAIANVSQFEGAGVYYAASRMESQLCGGEEVAIVGGGNSAGQAAVFLAQTAGQRAPAGAKGRVGGDDVALPGARIEEHPKITLRTQNRARRARRATGISIGSSGAIGRTGALETHDIRHAFHDDGRDARTPRGSTGV